MKGLRSTRDFGILTLIVAAFVSVASQRLGVVPVPEGDEAFTLQVPYEMLYRGKLALPMLRYLGGNIENVWHSFTPVYFLLLSTFHKLFGFGLVEGRAFNLVTAALTLSMVYVIGRRLFDWRAGLFAVTMLVGDQTFLERSRVLRNDYAAATLALVAFYLYEVAAERKDSRLYIASGLAVGAGVMCHTNILYMVGAICVLILLAEGWRAFTSRKLYLFAAGAFLVMAYEVFYDLIDYKNFVLQNRGDDLHFRVFSRSGLLQNLLAERERYVRWYDGDSAFLGIPQTTLHIFQALTVIAILYLIVVCARRVGYGFATADSRVRVFVVTATVVLFHALIVSHKRIYYMAHLAPWFAICVGVTMRDALKWISRVRNETWRGAKIAYRSAVALGALAVAGFCFQLVKEYHGFLTQVHNPEQPSFEETTTVLRSIVPEGLCPVAVKNPSVWLAFPEQDRCFATIESRMRAALDLDGHDYALITRLNALPGHSARDSDSVKESPGEYHLLGEMRDSPLGNLMIYYTGTDPRFLDLPPRRYLFNGDRRGYTKLDSEERH